MSRKPNSALWTRPRTVASRATVLSASIGNGETEGIAMRQKHMLSLLKEIQRYEFFSHEPPGFVVHPPSNISDDRIVFGLSTSVVGSAELNVDILVDDRVFCTCNASGQCVQIEPQWSES